MGWELGVKTDYRFESIRWLTDSEYREFDSAVTNLNKFAFDQRIFLILQSNYEDYENLLKEYSREPHLTEIIGRAPMNLPYFERIILEIHRRILNYLSAVRTFLDYSKFNLIKRCGKNSEKVTRFNEACHEAYDSSFAYRFVYELRNCAQHCTLPLKLELISKEVNRLSNEIQNSLITMLDRDELLNSYDWNKTRKLKKLSVEIQNLPSQFEINPYLAEMRKCLERISGVILDDQLQELVRSADYIQRLVYETKDIQGIPYVSRIRDEQQDSEGKTKQFQMEIRWMPLHLVDIVVKLDSFMKSKPKS